MVVVILSLINAAPTPFADEEDPLRLPQTTYPINYELQLTTNVHVGTRRFDGVVKIHIIVAQPTDTITLHSRGLIIDGPVFINDQGDTNVHESHEFDASKDFLHLKTTRLLVVDEKLTIEIAYHGNLQSNMAGFYRSSYTVDGTTRYKKCDNCYLEVFLIEEVKI